jgi:hypothetical protein
MKGHWLRLMGPIAGGLFLLAAVLAGWSVPVALIGGGFAMLAGALGALAFTRLKTKDVENSDE